VTIGTLPDDVLLKIFKFFVDAIYYHYPASNEWCILVHVYRRWRNLAFTFPHHLNLQLVFRPSKRSVNEMLDIWPELPIYIHDVGYPTEESMDNVVAALRLNHRVSGIRLEGPDAEWEVYAPLMQHPFPAMTYLWLDPGLPIPIKNVISGSLLGGSAPCLRVLHLVSVSFPALSNLLLSATNLVRLWCVDIPPSGYISPQEMVTGLSALTRLESLSLTFRPGPHPHREIRIPPLDTHTLLSALTYFYFRGVPGYIEELVAQIDAPLLESMGIGLFFVEVPEVSELAKFVRRADKLSLTNQAQVIFDIDGIFVTISHELLKGEVNSKTLRLFPTRSESDLRLSYLARFCALCLPTLSPFERLRICVPFHNRWDDPIDNPDPQWLDLLRLFNTVKTLDLSKYVAPHVVQVLRGLPAERVMEVLPALGNVFISRLESSGHVKKAISEFADARQLSGRPVSIHWEGEVQKVRK